MGKTGPILVTLEEIAEYTGRNRKTIKKWVEEENFPAVKVDGRWESNRELIDEFQRQRIKKMIEGWSPCREI